MSTKLNNALKYHNLEVVYRTIKTLQELLTYLKDKIDSLGILGIYEIKCIDCHQNCFENTRRTIKTRQKYTEEQI